MNDFDLEKKEVAFSYLLLVPLFLMVAVIAIFPVVYAVVLSFTDRSLFSTDMNFIGFENFRTLWEDSEFWESVLNTFVYAGSCTLFQVVAGLVTSLLLVNKFKGNYYFRAALTFPYLVPTIVAVLVFQWMLNDVFGIVNRALISLGLLEQGVGWFDDKRAMFSVVLVSVWRFFPFAIMLFVPALEAIPEELYEAARVDGASAGYRFFHVTLPHIKEVMFVIIVLRGIWMFNMFDIIWLLTGGGPIGKTQILPVYSFLQAFQEYEIGLGSATATAGLVVLVILMSFYFKVGKK
jgi:multiple sugar transport system permease protein